MCRDTARPANRGCTTKLHLYEGTSEPFDTFIARFENFTSHFQWDEEEHLFNLRNSLAKSVGNVLLDSGCPSSSSEFIALLHSRYSTEHQADQFRMELKTRRTQKGKLLQAVFQDIKRLMALAFLGQTGSMAEITAIDAFVDSFTNQDLRKQVLQKSPATLAEALTWAICIEAIDDTSASEPPASYDHDGCRDTRDTRQPQRAFAHLAASEGSVAPRQAPLIVNSNRPNSRRPGLALLSRDTRRCGPLHPTTFCMLPPPTTLHIPRSLILIVGAVVIFLNSARRRRNILVLSSRPPDHLLCLLSPDHLL